MVKLTNRYVAVILLFNALYGICRAEHGRCFVTEEAPPSGRFRRHVRHVATSLYSEGDAIVDIGAENFAESVYGSEAVWVVEFYLSWCGHCQEFALVWMAVGDNLSEYRNLVIFGAVNCALASNKGFCKQFGIQFVPKIMFFAPGSQHDSLDADSQLYEPESDGMEEVVLSRYIKHYIAEVYRTRARGVGSSAQQAALRRMLGVADTDAYDAVETATSVEGVELPIEVQPLSLEEQINNSSHVWGVLFCRTTIESCRNVMVAWNEFKKLAAGWTIFFKTKELDCAEVNCADNGVFLLPVVKFFKAGNDAESAGFPPGLDITATRLARAAVRFIESHRRDETPPSWPRPGLKATQYISGHAEVANIRRMNPDAQYVLLLLERSDQQASITGQQVLLDISNMRGVAGARLYGNLTDRQRAASSMYIEPTTWPIVVVFPPHGDRMQRLHWGSWRTSPVMRAVNDYLRKRMLPLVPPTYNRDLESSLWQSLSHDVQLVEGELNGDKMAALREYVGVLAKYYPGEQRVVRKLHQLLHWLWGRNATTLQEFSVKLTGKPDQPHGNDTYISDVVGWVACRGSQPRYRGYTCGLWQMFHSLTVAAEAANRSMNSGLQSSPSSPATDPLEVLHAMRSFVRHFFGCQVCRQNFLNHESVTMETDVHDHEGAMLWMWRVHNSVNRRLSGAFSEDPLSPKVQFPVESACPLCHGKVGWRPGDVLYYLRQMYGAGNIV